MKSDMAPSGGATIEDAQAITWPADSKMPVPSMAKATWLAQWPDMWMARRASLVYCLDREVGRGFEPCLFVSILSAPNGAFPPAVRSI